MKNLLSISICILITGVLFAQAPEKMSYQTVVRDGTDQLVTESTVGIQISILQGSAAGASVYVETHTPTTNANGLASLEIGGGAIVSGTFGGIDWSNGPFFIKTETDPTGGSSYSITGTSELLSVPYALFAKNAGSAVGSPWSASGDDIYNDNIGNVGIGTDSPVDKLSLYSSTGQTLSLRGGNSANQFMRFTENVSTTNNQGAYFRLNGGSNVFHIGTNYSNVDSEAITITYGSSSSKVGIGTVNPVANLDVNEGNAGAGNLAFRLTNSGSRRLEFISPGSSNINDPWILNTPNSIRLRVDNNNLSSLLLTSGGRVGIGTDNPQSKLSVNGKITCKEVEVTLVGFPDYVFEEDYTLLSLEEIEAYINEHGHLPNVPSASEVEKNGLGLGEMNKLLLEKVEELTLHLIQKDKELDILKEQIESVEERLDR